MVSYVSLPSSSSSGFRIVTDDFQVYAVGLRGTNCGDWLTLAMNKLLDGGCVTDNHGQTGCYWEYDNSKLHSRCVSAQADTAFMFLGFIACVGALIASFLSGRR